MTRQQQDALAGVRGRAAAFADALLRVDKAKQAYIRALTIARGLDVDQEDINRQIGVVTKGRPDRALALNQFAQQLGAAAEE